MNCNIRIIRSVRHCVFRCHRAHPSKSEAQEAKRMLSTTCVVRTDSLNNSTLSLLSPSLNEPSFVSQGLASSTTPSGWFQAILEQVHIGLDIPWWGTIVITTCAMRLLVLPLFIRARRNAAVTYNVGPQIEEIQKRMMAGKNKSEVLQARQEYYDFMSKHGISPVATLFPILGNASIFTSMFFALNGMANLPVESLKVGGLAWFTDLTVSDPYFLLPIFTTSSLLLNLKVGGDGASLDTLPPFMRKVLFALPLISLPVMCAFPTALNVYWMSSNLITITQARVMSIPAVRTKFGIPAMIIRKDSKPSSLWNFEEMKKENTLKEMEKETKRQ